MVILYHNNNDYANKIDLTPIRSFRPPWGESLAGALENVLCDVLLALNHEVTLVRPVSSDSRLRMTQWQIQSKLFQSDRVEILFEEMG